MLMVKFTVPNVQPVKDSIKRLLYICGIQTWDKVRKKPRYIYYM